MVTLDRVGAMSGDQGFQALKDEQGFQFTHVGEIRRADGSLFESADVFGVLERVRIGLDLALGRRVTCALPVGYVADKPVWARWRTTLLHPYRHVGQVLDDTVADAQIASIVSLMLEATSDAVALTALKAAVGYYTSANNDVTTDLSVSLPVSGLQLMAYYHFVSSNAATYSRSQWRTATPKTSDEIGLLLDDLKVDRAIPAHFQNLMAARASMSAPKQSGDALSTIIEMRNVVTHPTRDLPAETYNPYMWFEASTLARYWLCLSVLKEIGYAGPLAKIHQKGPRWTGQIVNPPWAPSPSP
ncbi:MULTISPECIES: hypothetical protein [unclassified Nocardioides]|uniref:hypothetical protein n=1 Tax=unclassified Nocardioides TaxID=2615069 RepID=UPI003014D7CA